VKALNRESQERWDDDGGAIALDLADQITGSECSMIDSTAFGVTTYRPMLLDHLETAARHVAECNHRIARQLHLIAKLHAKLQRSSVAEEFLRCLQVSRVVHLAGRARLRQALASLDKELEIERSAI